MRVVTLDSWDKAQVVVTHGVWGGSHNHFTGWKAGETVVVLVGREGVVTGDVSGPAYRSNLMVWDNDVYEWRIPLAGLVLAKDGAGRRLNANVRDVLRHHYGGATYGYVIQNGERLGDEPESRIRELLRGQTNAG